MTTAARPSSFVDDAARRPHRVRLTSTILVAAVAIVLSLVAELLAGPGWLGPVAAATALLALSLAAWAAWTLHRDDRLRRRDAEATIALSTSMLVVIDRNARIALANPAACAVFGRAVDRLVGEPIDRFFTAEDAERSRATFAGIMDGEVDPTGLRRQRTVVRPDGSTRTVAWRIAVREDHVGDVHSLLLSGDDITVALQREAARDAQRRDLEELRELARAVAASDDARQAVTDRMRHLIGASFVGLAEPADDDTGDWIYTTCTDGLGVGTRLSAGQPSGSVHAARTRERLFVGDATGDKGISQRLVEATGVRSLLFEPVLVDGVAAGVITAGWVEPATDLEERRGQLVAVAMQEAAMALQRIRAVRHLRTAALTDELTGLANRRAFEAELLRATARAARQELPLSLAVMDLDGFKALNDEQGHQAGDAVLVDCARAWGNTLRTGDLLARMGGDEFAIVLPHCSAEDAAGLAHRLRAATPHQPGAGIGVATWAGGLSPADFYRAADDALYADKAARRADKLRDARRLDAVAATGLWDAGTDAELDELVAEATRVLDVDGVYVTLVGAERVSYAGKPSHEVDDGRPGHHTFCPQTVVHGAPVVMRDAEDDPRGAGSAATATGLIAYAGHPLSDAAGNTIGVLCACHGRPRTWTPGDLRLLASFAHKAARRLDARARDRTAVTLRTADDR